MTREIFYLILSHIFEACIILYFVLYIKHVVTYSDVQQTTIRITADKKNSTFGLHEIKK